MNILRFCYITLRAFRRSQKTGNPQYVALVGVDGVPRFTLIVASGREAWHLSRVAVALLGESRRLAP